MELNAIGIVEILRQVFYKSETHFIHLRFMIKIKQRSNLPLLR